MDKFDARRATLDLVTAFVNNNSLNAQQLPSLLSNVYEAIARFGETKSDNVPPGKGSELLLEALETAPQPEAVVGNKSEAATATVSIEQSLGDPNYIISMITGEKLKTLARHLRRHGLDAQQYRARYNLPEDYPMVAPAYSQFRRDVAKKMALGRLGRARPVRAPALSLATAESSPGNDASTKTDRPTTDASSTKVPNEAKLAGKTQQIDTTAKIVRGHKRAAATSHAFVNSDAKPETLSDTTSSKATSATVANNDRDVVKKRGRPAGKGKAATAAYSEPLGAQPSSPALPQKKPRARVREVASAVTQKEKGDVVASSKKRRSKLKPVFND
tara:strand:- start:2322 stop:3314 length:993 start_codon:yes stop_codon:yes gene_type:complete